MLVNCTWYVNRAYTNYYGIGYQTAFGTRRTLGLADYTQRDIHDEDHYRGSRTGLIFLGTHRLGYTYHHFGTRN